MLCRIGYDIKQMDHAFLFLENFCSRNDIKMEDICHVKMIADEIVGNVINYADSNCDTKISLFVVVKNSTIRLRVVDFNSEFNPLLVSKPDVNASLECRVVGGLGIYLVRKIASRVSYKRQNGKNILTIIYKYGD